MYNKNKPNNTSIKRNESYKGETIEQKIARILNNKEPIKDGAPQIYTERKDGVLAAYDIRTDRWEVAVEAMDKVSKSNKAKRENSIAERAKKGMETEKKTDVTKTSGETTGGGSVQATGNSESAT